MKPSLPLSPVGIGAHVAFFGYRWLAWALAALALTLPGHPVATLPRDAGLLLLAGILNVVATALAQTYVRVAQARPAILTLDLVAGVVILWLSGSTLLPFMPYALSGLIVPTLLFVRRGGLVAAAAFIGLDLFGLTLLNPTLFASLAGSSLIFRLGLPLAFVFVWLVLRPTLDPTEAPLPDHSAAPLAAHLPATSSPTTGAVQPPLRPGSSDRLRSEAEVPSLNRLHSPLPLVLTRTTEQQADPIRRMFYAVAPTQDSSFTATLEQIGAALTHQSDVTVRVTSSGTPRPLSRAQQTVLVRTAQETLLNVKQHARATTALVVLEYALDHVSLVIQDDGIGLLDGTYERPGMHALRALRYRLAELDGEFAVSEAASGGLNVRATLPYEDPAGT